MWKQINFAEDAFSSWQEQISPDVKADILYWSTGLQINIQQLQLHDRSWESDGEMQSQ